MHRLHSMVSLLRLISHSPFVRTRNADRDDGGGVCKRAIYDLSQQHSKRGQALMRIHFEMQTAGATGCKVGRRISEMKDA